MDQGLPDFACVYEEHARPVLGFFAWRVRDRETAEDLTQLTFERALRAWGRFDRSGGHERRWLFTIARNLLVDHHRRDRSACLESIDECAPALHAPGPEQALTTVPGLPDALAALQQREREVVALRFGADLTGPEIADLLELRLANVHQILSRSLRKLRGTLERSDERAQGRLQAH
jgi:RNA polymerase sigma-70 factor, ECF subfamily